MNQLALYQTHLTFSNFTFLTQEFSKHPQDLICKQAKQKGNLLKLFIMPPEMTESERN